MSSDGQGLLRFNLTGEDFDAALAAAGAMPLPPYIAAKRPRMRRTRRLPDRLGPHTRRGRGADRVACILTTHCWPPWRHGASTFTHVTLHVGAGTFLPVKVEDVTTHRMHAEWGEVSAQAAAEIAATQAAGGRVIPVGTTALRLIESAARDAATIAPGEGETDIFIYPGFAFGWPMR